MLPKHMKMRTEKGFMIRHEQKNMNQRLVKLILR